jgi:hypothetical protein
MAIDPKTAAQFETDLAAEIASRDADADTALGPIKDYAIRPQARVFESQHSRIRKVSQLVALVNSDDFTDQDLDDFVANEGMGRKARTKATTTLTFSRATKPTADITIQAGFPVSTEPDEATGRSVTFVAIETKTLSTANAGAYYNQVTKRYELTVAARSLVAGIDGHVGANRIRVPRRSLSDFDAVTNRVATTGGLDTESNAALIDRYLLAVTGSEASTVDGTTKRILDGYVDVSDAVLAYGLDAELTRAGDDAGAVDAHVIGRVTAQVSAEPRVFTGVGNLIRVAKAPLLAVASVVQGATTFVAGADYEVVLSSSGNARSTRSEDGVRFLVGGNPPAIGSTISVTYTYNSLIETLQADFGNPRRLVIGRDLLVREAQQLDITIVAVLTVLSGFNSTAVRDQVSTALSAFINAMKCGQDVEEFDLDREVAKVTGVDNLVYSTLAKKGATGVGDIVVTKTQYPRISSADLVVTV